MTTQPRFWGHADTATRQGRLFRDDGPRESSLSCECGRALVRTPGGYLACPKGCGKLHEQCKDPAYWEGDDVDLFSEGD